jgi:hypothetical protein
MNCSRYCTIIQSERTSNERQTIREEMFRTSWRDVQSKCLWWRPRRGPNVGTKLHTASPAHAGPFTPWINKWAKSTETIKINIARCWIIVQSERMYKRTLNYLYTRMSLPKTQPPHPKGWGSRMSSPTSWRDAQSKCLGWWPEAGTKSRYQIALGVSWACRSLQAINKQKYKNILKASTWIVQDIVQLSSLKGRPTNVKQSVKRCSGRLEEMFRVNVCGDDLGGDQM